MPFAVCFNFSLISLFTPQVGQAPKHEPFALPSSDPFVFNEGEEVSQHAQERERIRCRREQRTAQEAQAMFGCPVGNENMPQNEMLQMVEVFKDTHGEGTSMDVDAIAMVAVLPSCPVEATNQRELFCRCIIEVFSGATSVSFYDKCPPTPRTEDKKFSLEASNRWLPSCCQKKETLILRLPFELAIEKSHCKTMKDEMRIEGIFCETAEDCGRSNHFLCTKGARTNNPSLESVFHALEKVPTSFIHIMLCGQQWKIEKDRTVFRFFNMVTHLERNNLDLRWAQCDVATNIPSASHILPSWTTLARSEATKVIFGDSFSVRRFPLWKINEKHQGGALLRHIDAKHFARSKQHVHQIKLYCEVSPTLIQLL